jgi:hypothetical protein
MNSPTYFLKIFRAIQCMPSTTKSVAISNTYNLCKCHKGYFLMIPVQSTISKIRIASYVLKMIFSYLYSLLNEEIKQCSHIEKSMAYCSEIPRNNRNSYSFDAI